VAVVEAVSSRAGTERSAAVEVTSAEGPSKPRAMQSPAPLAHLVGPTDAVEPSRPSGVTAVPADTSAAGRSSSDEPALEHQIVQSLRLHATSGGGEARVRLRPEYLGEVTIKVVVEDGVVSARLEASVPAVRDWAERHESSLRQALGEHGLTLDTFSVHDQPSADESRERFDRDPERDQEPRDRQRRPRRRDETAGPRFEVEA
jgi:flagellar hook-length control protein FliK